MKALTLVFGMTAVGFMGCGERSRTASDISALEKGKSLYFKDIAKEVVELKLKENTTGDYFAYPFNDFEDYKTSSSQNSDAATKTLKAAKREITVDQARDAFVAWVNKQIVNFHTDYDTAVLKSFTLAKTAESADYVIGFDKVAIEYDPTKLTYTYKIKYIAWQAGKVAAMAGNTSISKSYTKSSGGYTNTSSVNVNPVEFSTDFSTFILSKTSNKSVEYNDFNFYYPTTGSSSNGPVWIKDLFDQLQVL